MLAINPKKKFKQSAPVTGPHTIGRQKAGRCACGILSHPEHGVRHAQIRRELMPMGCATGNCFALAAFNRKLFAGGGTPVKNIRVEHIRVEGGQAIVGAITSRSKD